MPYLHLLEWLKNLSFSQRMRLAFWLLALLGFSTPAWEGEWDDGGWVSILPSMPAFLEHTEDSLKTLPIPRNQLPPPKNNIAWRASDYVKKKKGIIDQEGLAENHQTQRVGAICQDGSWSNSKGAGACAHHGGVKEWIYEEDEPEKEMYRNDFTQQSTAEYPQKASDASLQAWLSFASVLLMALVMIALIKKL
jgi:hypothetical protein